jgi:hypothetical protein
MWASAAAAAPQQQPSGNSDVAVVLQASAPFSSLVRLTIGVDAGAATTAASGANPAAAAADRPSSAAEIARATTPPSALRLGDRGEDEDGDGEAAERLAARARGAAAARRLRAGSAEVRAWCVARPQAAAPNTVQLLCPKVRRPRDGGLA